MAELKNEKNDLFEDKPSQKWGTNLFPTWEHKEPDVDSNCSATGFQFQHNIIIYHFRAV